MIVAMVVVMMIVAYFVKVQTRWGSKATPKGIRGPNVASERVTKGVLEAQSGHDRLRRDDFGAHFDTFL